jgi:predicted metalloendopeptidase
VNGRLTLGENIGDLSGMALAYRAYRRSLNGAQAPVIAGPYRRPAVLHGRGAGVAHQVPRAGASPAAADAHSPGQYRTNGVLVNLPAFYEAFNVKPGDRMYVAPEKRVKIW